MESSEQFQYNDGRITVPYDKGRKKVTFHDTYVDINGDIVRYDDIAIFQSAALDFTSSYTIYFSKSFTYNFTFTTYDGTVHELKRGGYSAYGMGTYKRIKSEFDPVAEPMYNIVLKKVCERVIDRIESGRTAKICGLTITKDSITFEKKKEIVVINRDNLGYCGPIDAPGHHSIQFYLKNEKKPVLTVSLNEPNARLIVPVVNCFFGK